MKGPHQIGEKIAYRYQIKGFVGEGGMQYVYCAWDSILNRYVALKTPKNLSAEKSLPQKVPRHHFSFCPRKLSTWRTS